MIEQKQYDYKFKIVLGGDSQVGKTALFTQYLEGTFQLEGISTVGIEFNFKTLQIDGQMIQLSIWDPSGQDRYRSIASSFFKGTDGVILVFDVQAYDSFQHIESEWIKIVEDTVDDDAELLLLGNKIDLENRVVTTQEAWDYAKTKNMPYLEVSAKSEVQVSEAFLSIVQKLIEKGKGKGKGKKSTLKALSLQQIKNEKSTCC